MGWHRATIIRLSASGKAYFASVGEEAPVTCWLPVTSCPTKPKDYSFDTPLDIFIPDWLEKEKGVLGPPKTGGSLALEDHHITALRSLKKHLESNLFDHMGMDPYWMLCVINESLKSDPQFHETPDVTFAALRESQKESALYMAQVSADARAREAKKKYYETPVGSDGTFYIPEHIQREYIDEFKPPTNPTHPRRDPLEDMDDDVPF